MESKWNVKVNEVEKNNDFQAINTEWNTLYSVYIPPKAKEEDTKRILEDLAGSVRKRDGPIPVAKNFNTKSPDEWGRGVWIEKGSSWQSL